MIVQLARSSVTGSSADLAIVMEELVDNACVYSRPGTPVRVNLDARGVLSVTDEGRGMTEAQIRQVGVFRQFERENQAQQGLGVGLFLVQKLAERCGASFSLESRSGGGTTAHLVFNGAGGAV